MKLIAGLVGLFALGMAGAAAAALAAKQRIVPIDDPEADEVALVAIFAPVMFHSTASAFRGGTLDCWYGGGIVDLRDATLDPAGAHLEVKAVFGGAQILVPSSWRVESSVSGVGAAQDMRPKPTARDRATAHAERVRGLRRRRRQLRGRGGRGPGSDRGRRGVEAGRGRGQGRGRRPRRGGFGERLTPGFSPGPCLRRGPPPGSRPSRSARRASAGTARPRRPATKAR